MIVVVWDHVYTAVVSLLVSHGCMCSTLYRCQGQWRWGWWTLSMVLPPHSYTRLTYVYIVKCVYIHVHIWRRLVLTKMCPVLPALGNWLTSTHIHVCLRAVHSLGSCGSQNVHVLTVPVLKPGLFISCLFVCLYFTGAVCWVWASFLLFLCDYLSSVVCYTHVFWCTCCTVLMHYILLLMYGTRSLTLAYVSHL